MRLLILTILCAFSFADDHEDHHDDHGDDHVCPPESEVLADQDFFPAGCGSQLSNYKYHVSIIVEAGSVADDGTFITLATEGAKLGCNENSDCCLAVDTPATIEDGYECEMEYAAENSDLTIGVGFQHQEAALHAAEYRTDRNFACIDVAFGVQLPNLEGITFREDQAGYLAGLIAGQVTTTKKLGVIAGPESVVPVASFVSGFINGVLLECPSCDVTPVYSSFGAGGFNNGDNWGVKEAQKMLESTDIDVIFGAGGYTGSAAIRYAALTPGGTMTVTIDDNGTEETVTKAQNHKSVYVVGVDSDEWTTTFGSNSVDGSHKIITSAMKRVDWGTHYAILRYMNGHVVGGNEVLGASQGGIDFADCHEACSSNGGPVTEAIINEVNSKKTLMISGELDTGVDLATGGFVTVTDAPTTGDENNDDDDDDDSELPGWATALIVVAFVFAFLAICCVGYIWYIERTGGKAFFTMQGAETVRQTETEMGGRDSDP